MVQTSKNIPIPSGYKSSPLGPIPEDWNVEEMGKITSLITNGFVGKATDFYVEEDGILYIQGYNVQENGFNFHGVKFVSKDFHRQHKKSELKEGDLLTIQTGDVGVTTYVPNELAGSNCHALIISRYIDTIAHSKYYHQFFNSPLGRKFLKIIETGSTMRHLNCGDMEVLKLPVPPLAEQIVIANLLSIWDEATSKVSKLIEQHEKKRYWLMQNLLTRKIQLSNFNGEWLTVKFNQVGIIPQKKPIVEIQDEQLLTVKLHTKGVELNTTDSVTISETGRPYYKRYTGEILIGRQNIHNGGVGVVSERLNGNICSNAISSFRVSEEHSPEYILYLLQNPTFYKKIENYMGGTGQKELSEKQFMEIEIHIPDFDEQIAISTILQKSDKEIQLLKSKLEKLKEQKNGLMQQLLTGKKRLKF